jgi:hypothetical protein
MDNGTILDMLEAEERDESFDIELYNAYKAFNKSRVRIWCYRCVLALDVAKKEALDLEFPGLTNFVTHAWMPDEYDKTLAHIRDYGIMHGLDACDVDIAFCCAHADAASDIIFKSAMNELKQRIY